MKNAALNTISFTAYRTNSTSMRSSNINHWKGSKRITGKCAVTVGLFDEAIQERYYPANKDDLN